MKHIGMTRRAARPARTQILKAIAAWLKPGRFVVNIGVALGQGGKRELYISATEE